MGTDTNVTEELLMSPHWARILITLLALMVIAVGLAACGGASEPELPDTTAASVVAYLDEVDYTESWELWPGLGEKYEG